MDQVICSRTKEKISPIRKELSKREILEKLMGGNLELEKMLCGCEISYSGTNDEEYNRKHYAKLMSLEENQNSENKKSIIFGCGAGYGAFYLLTGGWKGKILGEDWDQNSINAANFLKYYFNYPKVKQEFLKSGLKSAMVIAKEIAKKSFEASYMQNLTFNVRDSSEYQSDEKYDLLICDNIHNPEILNTKTLQNMILRINDVSMKGTVLSYRFGSEENKLKKIGFEKKFSNIYVKS